jgi:aminopeptidase N
MTARDCAALCLGIALAAACARPSPVPPPASAAPVAGRLPQTVLPDHYALTVAPDLANASFAGDVTIDVRVTQATDRIVLNAAEITFQEATIESGGRVVTAKVQSDDGAERATFSTGGTVPAGPARLHIKYTGRLNNQLRGLYLSKANNRRYAVTQLEATDARRMFPSFDEPAIKATFALTAIIDNGDRAISNGAVASDTPGPGSGKHTVTFATTPRMSSYLLALVVGDFECVSGAADEIPIRICATPDKVDLTAVALEDAQRVMRFYNRYFSIKYPYAKLDIVAVPDFSAGAMENTAAIFYREPLLLVDPKTMSVGAAKNVFSVLAHEMAHQWFGDLVTMAWWDDLWLNEGFATWMASKPLKAERPAWLMELAEVQSNLEAMSVDALASTRPVHAKADSPAAINEAFDALAYQKGAAVLRMIESYVGEEPFRRGINAYLEKFKYRNATGADFWTTVAQSTGTPVDKVMASFVDQPGVPVVSVTSNCAGTVTRVEASQDRYRTPEQKTGSGTWQIPVCMRAAGSQESAGVSCALLAAPRQALDYSPCTPTLVANARGAGYYRTAYAEPLLDALLRDVAGVSERERVMLASDAWALVRSGTYDAGVFLQVAQALAADPTSSVAQTLADALGLIGSSVAVDHAEQPYRAWVVRTFKPALDRVGWTKTPGEPDDRTELRATLIRIVAGTGHDPEGRARARTLLLRYLQQPGSLDATLADRLMPIAVEDGDAALYDLVRAKWRAARSPEERDRLLFALGRFRDPALVNQTMQLALSDQVRVQDTPRLLATALSGPAGRDRVWPLIRDRWDDIKKHMDAFTGPADVVNALGNFCDDGAAAEIAQFFNAHDAPGAARTLQLSVERITSCAALKRAQQPRLAAWLARAR